MNMVHGVAKMVIMFAFVRNSGLITAVRDHTTLLMAHGS